MYHNCILITVKFSGSAKTVLLCSIAMNSVGVIQSQGISHYIPYISLQNVTIQRQVGLNRKANCLESVSSLYTKNHQWIYSKF